MTSMLLKVVNNLDTGIHSLTEDKKNSGEDLLWKVFTLKVHFLQIFVQKLLCFVYFHDKM